LLASSRCREDVVALLTSRPVRMFPEAEFPLLLLRAPNPPVFPTRPADNARVSMVRTEMCEAAAPGAVRAITERFITDDGGVETRPRAFAFAAPVKLPRVGEKSARLVTCALRSDASVTRIDPRLMACPLTNALREAAVTARTLCAYA
jgi:hypothetical protein